jgi:C-terminal processing protease CtpA/Prc
MDNDGGRRLAGSANQPCHHRVSVLVNEHSTSASEMLTQFAKENQLATIIT